MVAVMKMASFGVSGAYLTEHSRNLMEQGDWKDGLKLLVDTLGGMTYEQAISVLEGDAKIVGAGDELRMIPESPEQKQALQERYRSVSSMGGFVKRNGRMYEAYLVIDNLGDADSVKLDGLSEYSRVAQRADEWFYSNETVHRKSCLAWLYPPKALELRAMYYAHRPDQDFAAMVKNSAGRDVVVLFQETRSGVTPFWREKESLSIQAAFDQVQYYLSTGGYSQRFGYRHPSEQPFSDRPTFSPAQFADEDAPPALSFEEEAKVRKAAVEAFTQECLDIRRQVTQFADSDSEYGWYTYKWQPKELGMAPMTLRAPHRALICYALSTTPAWELMPEYKAFSHDHMKTDEDNPYHTDVWLGCGLEINSEAYNPMNAAFRAVVDMMFEIQKQMLNFEVQVLARGPEVSGTVVFYDSPVITKDNILVVPHAGVEYELQTLKAGAVICQIGGKLAHLVTVCREEGKPVIRMDDAMAKLKKGQRITVSPAEGKVHISATRPTYN